MPIIKTFVDYLISLFRDGSIVNYSTIEQIIMPTVADGDNVLVIVSDTPAGAILFE